MLQKELVNYECDLHCHTNRSDGNNSPQELIDRAIALGMKVIAITDHDTVPPERIAVNGRQIETRRYAHERGIGLILGYEFSTDTYVDDVHILGLELDWSHPLVKQEVEKAKKSKSEAYRELCEILSARGMPIDFENEILHYTDEKGESRERDPDEVQRKFIFEKMAEKGYAESWGAAKIMVQDDPELNVRRRKIDPLETINLIHEAGGIAVLAHPYLIAEEVESPQVGKISRAEYIERLIAGGLDGIEARYTYNKTSYKGNMTVEEIEREVRERYGHRLLISGGSDYHGSKKGTVDPREVGEAGIDLQEFRQLFQGQVEKYLP